MELNNMCGMYDLEERLDYLEYLGNLWRSLDPEEENWSMVHEEISKQREHICNALHPLFNRLLDLGLVMVEVPVNTFVRKTEGIDVVRADDVSVDTGHFMLELDTDEHIYEDIFGSEH